MTIKLTRLVLAGALVGVAGVSIPANGAPQKARLSMEQARQIALNACPGGKIMKKELEHERGGSGVALLVRFKARQQMREIGVDAVTGKLLEIDARMRECTRRISGSRSGYDGSR